MKKRILLIDDSPLALALLCYDLSKDYDIVTAESGEEAVEILDDPVRKSVFSNNIFDLIITDLIMPGMNGLELADYVRERNRKTKFTPVILLSTEQVSKEDSRRGGCSAYFPKTERQRLISMVNILMSW
jgi:CheY-like chemotaxis protein